MRFCPTGGSPLQAVARSRLWAKGWEAGEVDEVELFADAPAGSNILGFQMVSDEVIATVHCSSMVSHWTEYLCMEVAADGSVTLISKGFEVLGSAELLGKDMVWPEGYDPDADTDDGERPLPLSIGGEKVVACEDGYYLGSMLVPHSDDSTATFKPGEWEEARQWVPLMTGPCKK